MCLILFAWQCHPEYRLVLLANRDEFHRRPSDPLAPWSDTPPLLAGRDRVAGGTWLGLGAGGRFAAVTNVRNPGGGGARSRGQLPLKFLRGPAPAGEALEALLAEGAQYGGFNLLLGDAEQLVYGNNGPGGKARPLPPGVHGLSNDSLNTPWPKSESGREELARALQGEIRKPELLAILLDERTPPDRELPDTGLGPEQERLLGRRFIRSEEYGTRAASLLLVRHSGDAWFGEWRFGPGGRREGASAFRWPGDGPPQPVEPPT